jgi:hypothetical protein
MGFDFSALHVQLQFKLARHPAFKIFAVKTGKFFNQTLDFVETLFNVDIDPQELSHVLGHVVLELLAAKA